MSKTELEGAKLALKEAEAKALKEAGVVAPVAAPWSAGGAVLGVSWLMTMANDG